MKLSFVARGLELDISICCNLDENPWIQLEGLNELNKRGTIKWMNQLTKLAKVYREREVRSSRGNDFKSPKLGTICSAVCSSS